MSNVAIIPARGGSKRIPNKNIKDFNGVPVIAYAIKNAIDSGLFAEIIVSTDSDKIAHIAKDLGASKISRRPSYLSDDNATTSSVMQFELKKFIEFNPEVEFACCIYPATPLLEFKRIQEAFEKINNGIWNFVVPCQQVKTNPERYFKLGDRETIELPYDGFSNKRTQDLPEYFYDAGQFYWGKREAWLNLCPIFSNESSSITLSPNEVVDIDTIADWQYAELLSKVKGKQL